MTATAGLILALLAPVALIAAVGMAALAWHERRQWQRELLRQQRRDTLAAAAARTIHDRYGRVRVPLPAPLCVHDEDVPRYQPTPNGRTHRWTKS